MDDATQPAAMRLGQDPAKGTCVFATRAIRAGELLGHCGGDPVDHDSVHSIHLGGELIDPAEPFRFISHACEPNAEFRDRSRWLHAVRDIPAGAEITIDYLFTEPRISAPFACHCGAPSCRKMICTPAANDQATAQARPA